MSGVFITDSVVNLSKKGLTEHQISMLSKRLKYSPTYRDIGKSKLKTDIEAFRRRVRLDWYFRDNFDINSSSNISRIKYELGPTFYSKSGWNPPRPYAIVESYLSLLEKEAISISPRGKNFSNLFVGERQALYELKPDRSIGIQEADKGSAGLVWDRNDYCKEAYRQKMV